MSDQCQECGLFRRGGEVRVPLQRKVEVGGEATSPTPVAAAWVCRGCGARNKEI